MLYRQPLTDADRRLLAGVAARGEPFATEHFADARRVLTMVTDQYLFPLRPRWFGSG
jgi:hypothetical protein